MEIERVALFPGRFQPPSGVHTPLLYYCWQNFGVDISFIMGVEKNTVRSFENPFLGEEVMEMVGLMLSDLGLRWRVEPELVDTMGGNMGQWISSTIKATGANILFTGNPDMAELAQNVRGLKVINPPYGSITKLRSSEVRRRIRQGEELDGVVTKSVERYIRRLNID